MNMEGKIALEEHFASTQFEQYVWESEPGSGQEAFVDERAGFLAELGDLSNARLAAMDELGVEIQVLSFTSPGIQDIRDPAEAVTVARDVNDDLAEQVKAAPDRYIGLAALPMQDPAAAADELVRAVKVLGFRGALVNGVSAGPDKGSGIYYDGPEYLDFWRQVAALDVPFYLHPRNPVLDSMRPFQGRPELLGPTWAFAVETGTHALRLITSGLFDEVPDLTMILGHLGEFLPFGIERLQQRLTHYAWVNLERPPRDVLNQNFYVTTSGNYHTPSLLAVIMQMGADRILFASDFPFEKMRDATDWFDSVPISEADRQKIGRSNAERLLALDRSPSTAPR